MQTKHKKNCKGLSNIAVRSSLKNKFKKTVTGERTSMGHIAEILIENFLNEVENKGFFMPQILHNETLCNKSFSPK